MKKSKAFTVSCVFSALIIGVLAVYAIFCLINSYILPELLVFLTAVSFLLSLPFILIKKIPDKLKAVVTGLIFILFSACFAFFNFCGGPVQFKEIEQTASINRYQIEFGDFDDISSYRYYSPGIFSDLAYTTIASYNVDAFEKQKTQIDNEYEFYHIDPVDDNPIPPFTVQGFEFRIAINDEYSLGYPKELLLIGINESSKEIAYVDFENSDLDSISDDYENFLEFYCGWTYIFK